MNSFLKKILLLWFILFSNFLFADSIFLKDISISDASAVHEYNTPLQFAVTIESSPVIGSITVHYKTINNGSTTAGVDYTYTEGDLTFTSSGVTTQIISVPVLNDAIHESDEYVSVVISENALFYEIIDEQGDGTIYDDDTAPLTIDVQNGYATENDGTTNASFHVTLNQNAPVGGVTITYSTADNTALAGSDYTQESNQTLTIPQGSNSGYILIPIIGDTTPEDTEQFYLNLSTSTGTLNTTQAIGTIYDDDAIKVDITSSDVDEGDSGDHNQMEFKIFLTKPLPVGTPSLTINYDTQDGSSPSATEGSDYSAKHGSVTFNVGDQDKWVYVDIIGDETIESDENLKMVISGSSYIINDSSESEILNDDGTYPSVDFSTGDASIVEGNSSTKTLNFHFELDAPALANSSFDYYTQDNTAQVSDSDYVEINSTTYNIPTGSTDIDIAVIINGDTNIENDELFYLKFTNEQNIVISGHTAKGTIVNDDGTYPTLSFDRDSYDIEEGNSSTQTIQFKLNLDKPAVAGSSFDYYTADGTATTSDNDYIQIARTTYNFTDGETNITIPVTINGDTDIEDNEYFYLKIDNEINLNITGTQSPKGNILNDDGSFPTISIAQNSYSIVEGNSSTTDLEIELTLDVPALFGSSIDYYTNDGSATDGSSSTEDDDYVQTVGSKDIPLGSRSVTIKIPINGDTNIEPDENLSFYIHNPKNLQINRNNTAITIENDDEHNEEPFTCDEHMYISSSKKRGSEDTGRMWIHRVDTTYNPFKFEVMDDVGETRLYNATAYNSDDNYIYGLHYRDLIKISKTGKIIDQGKINGLPATFDSYQLFAGAIYDSENYYVSGIGVDFNKMYKINLNDKNVTEIILSQDINIKDFSFSPDGKYLYGIIDGGQFTKIDANSGNVTKIGVAHAGEFDSSFSDKNGRFFANDSNGSGFYEFDTTTGTKSFLSNSQPATFNDGANCLKAELLFTDYSDAPSSYGKAWHNISNGILLGDKIDHDIDAYDTEDADGDDKSGVDDDDGVTLVDGSDLNGSYFEVNATHQLKIKLPKEAYVNIWLDVNRDGHFDNGNDLVLNHHTTFTAGEHIVDFSLPADAVIGKSYLRARVSTISDMDNVGFSLDGEVEDYIVFIGKKFEGIKGRFNIQRTNSAFNAKDFALYTQIVGRDFDYHVVFYDENLTEETKLEKVPLKIDLIDYDSRENLYTAYGYFSHNSIISRVPMLDTNDTITIPATKKALFQITYAINADGTIVQQECNSDAKRCFDTLIALSESNRTDDAKDMFAIRPESFYISIADGSQERLNSASPKSGSFASGYDYNLSVVAIKDRDNYPNFVPANGYDGKIERKLDFNTSGSCADRDDDDLNITFSDGIYRDESFSHNNVGQYRLILKDDENWTAIDQNGRDCNIGESNTSANFNTPSGCNISQKNELVLIYQPDHFKVDLTMNNLPNSGHPDFLYMSELNSTYSRVAIQFEGNITARTRTNQIPSNFTAGCVATNLLLDLNATTRSVEGINQIILTEGDTPVNFTRWIRFNNDNNTLDINSTLSRINSGDIKIIKSRFLDANQGGLNFDMRYNLNKHLREPINPVQVTFNSIEVNSTEANSTAYNIDTHTPKGRKVFINNIKNFYYTRVVSKLYNYPRVNVNISPVVRTPLNVDIYCDTNVLNYCSDTNVTANTNLSSTIREQLGWYISTNHNSNLDGNVTGLHDNPNIVTVRDNLVDAEDSNVTFNNGENNLIDARINNCNLAQSTVVTISTTPELQFEPSEYIINCTDNNASQWIGIGRTGNILNIQPKVNRSQKMDW